MTSIGQPINLCNILDSLDNKNRNNIFNKTENNSNHHHHHRNHHYHDSKSESKVELDLDFPVVVSLKRSRLDSKSRTLLENSKQLLSSPSSLTSSPSPSSSSSSSSCLHDTGALLMILNHLNPKTNQNHHQQHQHHFVIENVGHIDLLFGEELYRKSSDGSLTSTGRRLEIPKHFDGWFEIISQDGRSSQQITDVSSLVKRNTKHFLITKPTKALTIQKSNDASISTSLNDYKQVTLSVGHELSWFQLVTLCNGVQYLSCRLKHFRRQGEGRGDGDESGETVVLLPLTGQGRFLPVSRDSNLTDAHDALFLMSKLHMPLVVRMYWPPLGRNIAPPSIRADKTKDSKKLGFFQRRSMSSTRIEPASFGSPSSGEFMTSTIVRIHGHARQKVLYMSPMMLPHETGSSVSVIDLQDELKVVALRSQACKFFDVAVEMKLKVKTEVLESLKKKKQLVQSAFEKEVKLFDTTLYKMTGEKLAVNKQPISVVKENEVMNQVQQMDGVILRPDECNQNESVAKRRSLPLDVTLEMRNGGPVRDEDGYDKICTLKDDDESLLMSEIENIYMRVRYWDRSVRYPLPQKSTSQQQQQRTNEQQISQHKQHQRISTKLKQSDRSQQQQQQQHHQKSQQHLSHEVEITKTELPEPPVPPRNHHHHLHHHRQQRQPFHLPPPPPQPRTTTPDTSDDPPVENNIDDVIETDETSNQIDTTNTNITTATTSTTSIVASTPVATNNMDSTTSEANKDSNNRDIKGTVKNVFRNLVKKHKGSMDVAKLAGDEFSYFRTKHTNP